MPASGFEPGTNGLRVSCSTARGPGGTSFLTYERSGDLACQTPTSLAGEVQSTEDEGVENSVRGDDAVADTTGSLAAIGLQVDQVLLLLGPDQLDQAAETGVWFDDDPFLLNPLLDDDRELLGFSQVEPLQRLEEVV